MADAPDLSVVLTGRNDNYGGDFTTRLIRTLRFNWEALRDRGVSCEVVFVEWNPVSGRPPLLEILRDSLPEIAPARLRGYIVDRGYHVAFTLNPKLEYLEYVAKNVGVRRARGRMVLATNADVFMSRGVVDALAGGGLEHRVVYRAARIDLALGSDQSRVTWETLDDSRAHARRPVLTPPLYAGGAGDFLLLDRESWHTLRGFNEVYRAARVGIDRNFLVKAYGCGYRICDMGCPVYHVNHPGSYSTSRPVVQDAAAETAWGKWQWAYNTVVYDNPDGWGLRNAPEKELREGAVHLDFDWKGVPPVVDLRRVVLPLRRVATASDGAEAPR